LADYAATIANLNKVFPDDQVWLGFYEDIHADRLKALGQICAFIGVGFEPARFPGVAKRYNISQEVAMPDAVRDALTDRYRSQTQAVEKHIGRVPGSWVTEFKTPERMKKKTPARM
ncbi:MAG: hypothetical protein OEM91_17360, partial [Hyphomicrobiales bacterium]|nr:hypothetical protein [Hyphomicrobiales bacterium]